MRAGTESGVRRGETPAPRGLPPQSPHGPARLRSGRGSPVGRAARSKGAKKLCKQAASTVNPPLDAHFAGNPGQGDRLTASYIRSSDPKNELLSRSLMSFFTVSICAAYAGVHWTYGTDLQQCVIGAETPRVRRQRQLRPLPPRRCRFCPAAGIQQAQLGVGRGRTWARSRGSS